MTGGQPTYLGLEGGGTLLFMHEPTTETRGTRTAVLLCPPFGWEEVCCSRSMRSVAAALARAGHPTARLTLPCTADGAGGPRDRDQLGRWISAVGGAAAWLRERTGAARCVAFGIGLGGMLAFIAAAEHEAIDDLALWAVPDRGSALLREAKSLSKVIASDFRDDQGHDPSVPGDLNLIGYLMTAETQQALSGLELSTVTLPTCDRRRVLLLSRGAVRVDQRLQESLERQRADVEVVRTTDYYGLMVKPEQSLTPEATLTAVIDWLARAPAAETRAEQRPAMRMSVRTMSGLQVGAGVVESPLVCLGSHGEVFGIVARHPAANRAPFALLLVGAGALPHTGPNRTWVEMARRWAARGIVTVRLDVAGIGEAGGDGSGLMSDETQYAPWRVDDVRTVLDRLQTEGIAERFVLGGLCSGANCALQTGLADPRVTGLLLINLFLVTWNAELVAARARRGSSTDALLKADDLNADCLAERRQIADAAAAFDLLDTRATDTLLLFGEQEALYKEFVRQELIDQLDRWSSVRLESYTSGDQMFRAQWLQRYVNERLDGALERMLARSGTAEAERNRLIEELSV